MSLPNKTTSRYGVLAYVIDSRARIEQELSQEINADYISIIDILRILDSLAGDEAGVYVAEKIYQYLAGEYEVDLFAGDSK